MSTNKNIEIINKLGMHARAAAQFVQLASTFSSHIEIEKDKRRVNGKSIMGVMMLAASKGSTVTIYTNGEDEADWELGWNLSLLYHMTSKLKTLLEFDGESVYGGEEDEFDGINITPGIKFQPTDNPNLEMGLGVSFPLTEDKDFHVQTILSLFYHF